MLAWLASPRRGQLDQASLDVLSTRHDRAAVPTMSASPPISVCLLVYNHAALVQSSVESVLAQDFRDFELILSDDCSTDGSWDVLQTLAAADPRIRLLRTPRNLGMCGNANFAVAAARGRYIALLHHDDLCARELLGAWLAVIEHHPEMGFVSNGYANYASDVLHCESFPECSEGVSVLERRLLPRWDSPFRGTALIRRSAWEAVGGMRERFGMLADVDLWMRLCARGSVGYVAKPLITVRQQRPDNYPREYVAWSWARLRLLYDLHGVNRREHDGRAGVASQLRFLKFRARVSADVTRWLAYAIVKRRWGMLADSGEVENEYELGPGRWVRRGLAAIARRRGVARP
jgi:glycosyltransferase involved in cell wall biosynthesis